MFPCSQIAEQIIIPNLLDRLDSKEKGAKVIETNLNNKCGESRKIFSISNKHKECVHNGEDHTAVDHTCEECSNRTNLEANYLKHSFSFKDVGKPFVRSQPVDSAVI